MKPRSGNPFNARLAVGLAQRGFRKWYERELLSGHAHLVLAVLSLIGLLGSLEAYTGAAPGARLMNAAMAAACAVIALWALRRYLFLMMRAEDIANQAVCAECGEYGRFELVAEDRCNGLIEVKCRKCAHRWVIESTE